MKSKRQKAEELREKRINIENKRHKAKLEQIDRMYNESIKDLLGSKYFKY